MFLFITNCVILKMYKWEEKEAKYIVSTNMRKMKEGGEKLCSSKSLLKGVGDFV